MTTQMAIMKHIGFGCRGEDNVILWFDAYIASSVAALQVLSVDQAVKLIRDYGVYDVKDLEGKPCLVEVEGNTVRYSAPCKI